MTDTPDTPSNLIDRVAPTNPADALTALRANKDALIDDHVRLFQAMPLRDRLEFIFRTQLAISIQLGNIIAHLNARKH